MNISESVEHYYLSRWGQPTREASFSVNGFTVRVFKWTAEASKEGVAIYATCGASVWPILGKDPGHRQEFFSGLSGERDDLASPLAALGLYSKREHTSLDHGHSVSAGRELWPGSGMSAFLILAPRASFIAPLALDGVHVHFLQAVPIYEIEREYSKRCGASSLLNFWQQKQTPFWAPDREASVPG